MKPSTGGDPPVREQPVQLTGSRSIESELDRRAHQHAQETRARARLHVQQKIKTAGCEHTA